MMQPRNAKLYVGVIDKVSQQLVDRYAQSAATDRHASAIRPRCR